MASQTPIPVNIPSKLFATPLVDQNQVVTRQWRYFFQHPGPATAVILPDENGKQWMITVSTTGVLTAVPA
jgi:hypothetical protein